MSVITVQPLSLAQVAHPAYERALPDALPFTHQAEVYDTWPRHQALLLVAPTGGGKTQAAAFPVLDYGESAIFVYPTNALAEDQERSICRLLDRMRMPYFRLTADVPWDADAYRRARAVIIRVEGQTLEQFRRLWHQTRKGQVLARLLSHQEKPLLLLTNPDTLFLMLALRYHAGFEILSRLQGFQTLVIDEFHLYSGVELATLLFMVHSLLRQEGFLQRVVFLSATPQQEVLDLLDRLFTPKAIAAQVVPESHRPSRRVLHPVDLKVISASHIVEQMADRIGAMRSGLSSSTSDPDFVPLVVIVNSVLAAIHLEDLLVRRGFDRNQLGIYRGLSDRAIRDTRGKLIVIGTGAIEVGVDFDAGHLLFEARSGPSFLQRFGRIGRHRAGSAVLFAPDHVVTHARQLAGQLNRDELARLALQWYGEFDAQPWFSSTGRGLLACAVLLDRYASLAGSSDVARQLRERRAQLLSDFGARLGVSPHLLAQVQHLLKRPPAWLASYARAQSFRSSGLSVPVFDVVEARRRGEAAHGRYEAELRVLLERACQPEWCGDHLRIQGYGERQRVTAESQFADNEYGRIKPCSEARPFFIVDGNHHPLSNFAQRDEHVVVKIPPTAEPYLDWRMDYYPTRGGFLLFDGNALLGCEICERHRLLTPVS
jgi:CRISPR-associated helicase Cas3